MKAMILAAGLGTRMRPLTDHCPKPMLKVAGKPLIQHHIERLVSCGVTEIVINLAYLGEQIETYLENGERWGANIRYSKESEPLETGGGIFRALPLLSDGEEPFLLVNGDVWCDIDYRQLLRSSMTELAHLVLVDNPSHNIDGDFQLRGRRVCDAGCDQDRLTYSGVAVINPHLFDDQEDAKFALAPLLRQSMNLGQVSGRHYQGCWIDVGTPERLQQLDLCLRQCSLDSAD